MTKPVILTGLRANNDLHIGNYFGAMMPIVEMAQQKAGDYQINMFIPDLHSFTTPIDHSKLQAGIINNARLYAAAGLPLDNDDILLYRQSFVPAHSELTWILDCFTGFGEMRRMTQFKDKALISDEKADYIRDKYRALVNKVIESFDKNSMDAGLLEVVREVFRRATINEFDEATESSLGLFNYPVLMASDILLYDAQYVPVGEDQTQHLEFTRDVSERMNRRFGELFTIPKPVDKQHEFFNKGQALRIKDLADPTKKMSKSADSDKGVIFLTDNPGEAARKIMAATTDDKANINYDPIEQPGISNLLQILSLLRGQALEDVETQFKGQERYGDFKKIVADELAGFLVEFQVKLADVNDDDIYAAFERSEKRANEHASATLLRVQQAVGLRPRA